MPEITVAPDGTIYLAALWEFEVRLLISTDGGDTFNRTTDPATGITELGPPLSDARGFPVFPGGNFRVLTDPTCCAFGNTVVVAWADLREGVSRIYYALSNDRGNTWVTGPSGRPLLSVPIPSNFQHFHPQIVVDPNGVIGCSFYEFGPKPSTYLIDVIMAQSFDLGASFIHFTVTDQPWDPSVDAPWSHGDSSLTFIGDYMGLDANARGFFPLWTDTRTGIQELFTSAVPERRCQIIVERSTIGQDEVDARRLRAGGSAAIITEAFRVVVDGYSAAQLGLTSSANTLSVASPWMGMTIHCSGNNSDSGGYGAETQRFTFHYYIDFG
ncbi:MAG: exo-alpha-sialidase, partial [Burkholderia sp.]|nr:exo-alpha-sialidase [Burkholderia sp.]